MCFSQPDEACFIRTSMRFFVGDWVLGPDEQHPDEPKVFVEVGPRSAIKAEEQQAADQQPAAKRLSKKALKNFWQKHAVLPKEEVLLSGWSHAVRMDVQEGSKFNAYTIRKALKVCAVQWRLLPVLMVSHCL